MYFPLEYVNCLVPCLIFVTDNATTRTSVVLNKTLILYAIDHLESSKKKEGEGKKQEKETNQPRKVVQNTLKCSNKPALWSKGAGWCLCHTVKKMWVEQKASWAKKQEEKQSASVRLCKISRNCEAAMWSKGAGGVHKCLSHTLLNSPVPSFPADNKTK